MIFERSSTEAEEQRCDSQSRGFNSAAAGFHLSLALQAFLEALPQSKYHFSPASCANEDVPKREDRVLMAASHN
jgi:hypothetical protein